MRERESKVILREKLRRKFSFIYNFNCEFNNCEFKKRNIHRKRIIQSISFPKKKKKKRKEESNPCE